MRDVFLTYADVADKKPHDFAAKSIAAILIFTLLCFSVSFFKLATGGGRNA